MTDDTNNEEYIEEEVIERRVIPITEESTELLYFRRKFGVFLGVFGGAIGGISAYAGVDSLMARAGKKHLDSILSPSFDYLQSTLPAETEAALKQYEFGNGFSGKEAFETIEKKLQDARGQFEQQKLDAVLQGVDLQSVITSTAIAENVVKNTAQGYVGQDIMRPHVVSTIKSVQQTALSTRAPISQFQYNFDVGFSIIFTLIGVYALWKGTRWAFSTQREINRRKLVKE